MTEDLAFLAHAAKVAVREAFPHYDGAQMRDLWMEPQPEFEGASLWDLYMSDADDLRRVIMWAADR